MVLTVILFFLATFGMVSAAVIGYRFYRERQALLGRTADLESPLEFVEPADLLKADSLSTISFWDRLLARVDYVKIMKQRMAEGGLNWSVGRLTALMLLTGAVGYAVLMQFAPMNGWPAVAGACLVSLAPYAYVLRLRDKRLSRFESQFPDALDSLARALRAGHPLAAGLQMLVYEAPEPLASEMRITAHERELGRSWEEALDNLAERLPLVEVSIFAAAVKLQNRTGGKLSEVLGRLSESMRESHALKSEVRSIAAHGKLTGRLLTVLPVVIAAIMASVNPRYLETLWTQPVGKDLVVAAAACLVAAHFVIKKLVDIRI